MVFLSVLYASLRKVPSPIVWFFLVLGTFCPLFISFGILTVLNDGTLSKVQYHVPLAWVRLRSPKKLTPLFRLSNLSTSIHLKRPV